MRAFTYGTMGPFWDDRRQYIDKKRVLLPSRPAALCCVLWALVGLWVADFCRRFHTGQCGNAVYGSQRATPAHLLRWLIGQALPGPPVLQVCGA